MEPGSKYWMSAGFRTIEVCLKQVFIIGYVENNILLEKGCGGRGYDIKGRKFQTLFENTSAVSLHLWVSQKQTLRQSFVFRRYDGKSSPPHLWVSQRCQTGRRQVKQWCSSNRGLQRALWSKTSFCGSQIETKWGLPSYPYLHWPVIEFGKFFQPRAVPREKERERPGCELSSNLAAERISTLVLKELLEGTIESAMREGTLT